MYHTDIVVGNFIGLGVSVCMVGGTLLLGRGTARGLLGEKCPLRGSIVRKLQHFQVFLVSPFFPLQIMLAYSLASGCSGEVNEDTRHPHPTPPPLPPSIDSISQSNKELVSYTCLAAKVIELFAI